MEPNHFHNGCVQHKVEEKKTDKQHCCEAATVNCSHPHIQVSAQVQAGAIDAIETNQI